MWEGIVVQSFYWGWGLGKVSADDRARWEDSWN